MPGPGTRDAIEARGYFSTQGRIRYAILLGVTKKPCVPSLSGLTQTLNTHFFFPPRPCFPTHSKILRVSTVTVPSKASRSSKREAPIWSKQRKSYHQELNPIQLIITQLVLKKEFAHNPNPNHKRDRTRSSCCSKSFESSWPGKVSNEVFAISTLSS